MDMKRNILNCESILGERLADKIGLDISLYKKEEIIKFVSLEDNPRKTIEDLIANLNTLLVVDRETNEIKFKAYNKNKESVFKTLGVIEGHKITNPSLLAAYEIKTLSQAVFDEEDFKEHGFPFVGEEELPTPVTDLHTHFTGVISASRVYEIALMTAPKEVFFDYKTLVKNNIISREEFLKLADGTELSKARISLEELDKIPGFKEKLISIMEIPIDQQSTFVNLNTVYDVRNPFFGSRSIELFDKYVDEIAEIYSKSGVKYCEMSMGTNFFIANPKGKKGDEAISLYEKFEKKMEHVRKKFEQIKRDYGVDINFLIANSRSMNSREEIERFCDSIRSCCKYPFVVGMDILGHEKTSNEDFKYAFAYMARFCNEHNLTKYTIRCHTGESKEFIDNTKVFLKSIYDELELIRKEKGSVIIPDIRIGHGLNGMDDETIELCKKLNATIEINASSNFSLNNLDFVSQIPIKKYIDMGLNIVIGTDGNGVYQTDSRQEAMIANRVGVSKEYLQEMVERELKYIEEKQKEVQVRESFKEKDMLSYSVKSVDKPTKLKSEKIDINKSRVESLLNEHKIIFVSGTENELNLTEEEKIKMKEDVDFIVNRAKEQGEFICLYQEGKSYLNDLIIDQAKKKGVQFYILHSYQEGEEIDEYAYGENKFETARNIANYIGENGGRICVIGGDNYFSSELITQAYNNECELYLDANVRGASKDKAKLHKIAEEMNESREEKEIKTAINKAR